MVFVLAQEVVFLSTMSASIVSYNVVKLIQTVLSFLLLNINA